MANKLEETTREFTLEFLKQITKDFSEKHRIGRGGYGLVYKGKIENGEEIALKRLHQLTGFDDTEFMNEFDNLMRARHPNVTPLVGYCYNRGLKRVMVDGGYVFVDEIERILCFEYFSAGSLDKHISDESSGLDWHKRFKIIEGVCAGLNYLHNGCEHSIYHLDMKPENILLDKNLLPKIGDFGLSRLISSGPTYVAMKIIGTPGYMPPEYIHRREITPKYDVFGLGVIIVRIMAGDEGCSKCAHMSPRQFLEHVHANWGKRMQETMSPYTSKQIVTCIMIALRCMQFHHGKRPTIAEIVDGLEKIDTTETLLTGQIDQDLSIEQLMEKGLALFEEEIVDKDQIPKLEGRGGVIFSTNYRPPVPLDIFSSAIRTSSTNNTERCLTDGLYQNYNGCHIPPAALKTLVNISKLADQLGNGITNEVIDAGHVSGIVFVSERDDGLETLYIALRYYYYGMVKVFALADIFGAADFSGARLEDSGCIGGGYSVGSRTVDHWLIYISTKEPVQESRCPWTVVYKTSLRTGKTERLTPQGVFDLSPAVSPSGEIVAVASFQSKSWNGEVENLKTDIYVMNVDSEEQQDLGRKLLIKNGGWPSWGSDKIIFFHRATEKTLPSGMVETSWGVFRYNIITKETVQATPEEFDAVTPAAISETKVAVATIRQKSKFSDVRTAAQYRHIEIFDMEAPGLPPVQITQKMMPKADHYNPFVLAGEGHIGYHRCKSHLLQHGDLIPQNFHKVQSPVKDVSLLRVSGVFPTISTDGSQLAFVDNEFKAVWIADSQGLRIVFEGRGTNSVFSPVWNQNTFKDTLYVCVGPSFGDNQPVEIYSIQYASRWHPEGRRVRRLTNGGFNNAFPSSNPQGKQFVFRSTRAGGEKNHKNLYIMLDEEDGEFRGGEVERLTEGEWTDTQCQWSPNGDWIVFSSTRHKPFSGDAELDNTPGYFSVYLVKVSDPAVVIRVMESRGGHVNHPVFSPDGRSIAVTADLAAVSVDPISLPMFVQAVRPYGDIFIVDIDPVYLETNKDVKQFRRMTHSRYECGTPAWTLAVMEPNPLWSMLMSTLMGIKYPYKPACPYIHADGGESRHMTGHLCIPNRSC